MDKFIWQRDADWSMGAKYGKSNHIETFVLGIPNVDLEKIEKYMKGDSLIDITTIIGSLSHELGHAIKQHSLSTLKLEEKKTYKKEDYYDLDRQSEWQADEVVPSKLDILRAEEKFFSDEVKKYGDSFGITHPLSSERAARFAERAEKLEEGVKGRKEDVVMPTVDIMYGPVKLWRKDIPDIKGTSPVKAAKMLGGKELADYYPSLAIYESIIIKMVNGKSVALAPEFFDLSPALHGLIKLQGFNNEVSFDEIMPDNIAQNTHAEDLVSFNNAIQSMDKEKSLEEQQKSLENSFDTNTLLRFAALNEGFQITQLDDLLKLIFKEKKLDDEYLAHLQEDDLLAYIGVGRVKDMLLIYKD